MLALAAPLGARQRPVANPEVYIGGMEVDWFPLIKAPITDISNNADYDNQPSFTPDGQAVLFTSKRDGKQNDIYRFDLASKTLTQLTHTPENEYSPLVMPDGKSFSAVRIEADGKTQRLWQFDLDGSNPRVILENVKGVGYHAWLDATHVAVFIVGENGQPNTLQLADMTTGNAEMIDSNPGHGLALRPGPVASPAPTLTYVCKTDPQKWVVKEFDLKTRVVTTIADAVPGSEDLAWDPLFRRPTDSAARLLMPSGSKIFAMSRGVDGTVTWKEAADLTAAGVTHVTRIAVKPAVQTSNGFRVAFVAEPVSK